MNLLDFDYALPKDLIAQEPVNPRDASRLLVVDRKSAGISDRVFRDVAGLIPPGDILVLNDTKVFPARLCGKKKGTGGKVEILLLDPVPDTPDRWRCLLQPAMREGQEMLLNGGSVEAIFEKRDREGIPIVLFKNISDVRQLADRLGQMPLPPYIKREPGLKDLDTYQTVYARNEGAVAAPTAGLHFTEALLEQLKKKGIEILKLTLHVGYGTFRPVDDLENHRIHSEQFELSQEVADRVNQAKSEGKKVWAVGTTTTRVLETCVQRRRLSAGKGETNLYIKPPFEFEIVDHLITNFHLPRTTLLLLVSAFMGEDLRKKAYAHAVGEKYRFYSYGDAMVII